MLCFCSVAFGSLAYLCLDRRLGGTPAHTALQEAGPRTEVIHEIEAMISILFIDYEDTTFRKPSGSQKNITKQGICFP